MNRCSSFFFLLLLTVLFAGTAAAEKGQFKLASFSADVTIPIGHRCMGVLPTKSKKIVDRLYVHGFVLLGGGKPIVFTAVDWCEIRNGAYDQWRDALAKAAGTVRQRVLVSSLHQHDAPVTDSGAARLLRDQGLKNELYDERFHADTIKRVSAALKISLRSAKLVTHLGLGQAKVKQIASNRRVILANGRVSYGRSSSAGRSKFHREAADGLIDPYLKTISFWNGKKPLLAMHSYATHPMSYYGRGEVTSDFVGLARERRQRDDFSVKQVYFSGCSGDVTAGKYNDGSHDRRLILVKRLYQGMVAAWKNTKLVPLSTIGFRNTQLDLEFHPSPKLTKKSLQSRLRNKKLKVETRILAAMGLSSRLRVAARQKIDFPCVDLGAAQIILFPGESFVGYQLMAQKMRPKSFVFSIGYGECWPGYIPTKSNFDDGFGESWLWVAASSEKRIRAALGRVLK